MKKHFLIPARFRPFHHAHKKLIDNLLKDGDVTILLCWADILNDKSPIMAFESKAMIKESVLPPANATLEIYQAPYFGDDALYVKYLSNFLKEDRENYVVTSNPIVRNAVFKFLNIKIIDAYNVVGSELQKLSATLVRNQIINGDNNYISNIPQGTIKVINRANIIQRIKEIRERGINILLGQNFVIKVNLPDGALEFPFPGHDQFLDDYIVKMLNSFGYLCGEVKEDYLERRVAGKEWTGRLIPIGIRGNVDYCYVFSVA